MSRTHVAEGLAAALVSTYVAGAMRLTLAGAPLFETWVGARTHPMRVALGGHQAARIEAGELWRLATGVFVHVDLLHLALNAMAVAVLGGAYARRAGPLRMATTFAVGGLAGAALTHLVGTPRSDGASGAAFALAGALLAERVARGAGWDDDDRWTFGPALAGVVVLNFLLGALIPGIDSFAHFGGLVAGVALGRWPPPERIQAAVLIAWFALLAFAAV